jgi:hypothetical protein
MPTHTFSLLKKKILMYHQVSHPPFSFLNPSSHGFIKQPEGDHKLVIMTNLSLLWGITNATKILIIHPFYHILLAGTGTGIVQRTPTDEMEMSPQISKGLCLQLRFNSSHSENE